jgi:N-acetylmuramoyl-L-alanine amidase
MLRGLMRAAGALVLLLAATLSYSQQNAVRILFADSSKPATVQTFRVGSTVYASLVDLATAIGQDRHYDEKGERLEFTIGANRLSFSADNCFIGSTDRAKKLRARQLRAAVIRHNGILFAPLRELVDNLSRYSPTPLSYNPASGVINVGSNPELSESEITSLEMESRSNGMIITLHAARAIKDIEHWTKPEGWLYVTLPSARTNVKMVNATKPAGIVRKVEAIQSPGSLQLTFRLTEAATSVDVTSDAETNAITLLVRTKATISAEKDSRLDEQRSRWAMDVVVIDPGHGGKDWGASGVTGVKEKTVTLGVGLKLGALIRKNLPGVKAVFTRNDDRFIELDRRGSIANEADGKLFISIHCNSLPRKPSPTRGFEVYLLRPGRTNEAIAIAERENAVIQMEEGFEEKYKHLQDENFILTTMARSAHVKASEVFADLLQQEMENRTGIPNRGVKQAGFYVLVGASMPNVLVETAYVSNRKDEQFLKSESGQQKIAESIFRAVKKYKAEYEKLLKGP